MRKAWPWKQASYCMLWKEMHTSRKFEEFFRLFFHQVFNIDISIRLFLSFLIRSWILLSPIHICFRPRSVSLGQSFVLLSFAFCSQQPPPREFRCLQLLPPPPLPLPYTDAIVPSSVLQFIRFHSSTLSPIGPCHLHLRTVYLHSTVSGM